MKQALKIDNILAVNVFYFKLVTQNAINLNHRWVEMRNRKKYLKTLSRFVENVTVYILSVKK